VIQVTQEAVYAFVLRRKGDDNEEGMEDWDQDKLEEVVKQKHGSEKNRPTDIICKFFLDAVEKKQYGWCVVRHQHIVVSKSCPIKHEGDSW
jgi:hypothetical protein